MPIYYPKDNTSEVGRIAFEGILSLFGGFRDNYLKSQIDCCKNGQNKDIDDAKLKAFTRLKREIILKGYVGWLKQQNDKYLKSLNIEKTDDNIIDYDKGIREYYNMVAKEDCSTVDMDVYLYVYLLTLTRRYEESISN